ncbi:MAG: NADH-quinone oxidoreductase subunit NuoE [Candidatus Hydrogenedentes bacterium]|nr:NADH-quinone oxidoreductase subunit NuoE [Candidatus Hydrogenedentota bacterium]
MFQTQQDKLNQDIQRWGDEFGRTRSALIPILQEIQAKYFHVSEHAMQVVANMLDIHPVEVYGVVSFYSFLDHRPKGKFIIRLCRTLSCAMQNKDRVARQLENDLGISFGETTPDGRFTLEWANCIGMCDQGPAMLVNDHVFTRVTPDKVHDILDGCRRAFGVFATEKRQEYLV